MFVGIVCSHVCTSVKLSFCVQQIELINHIFFRVASYI